MVATAQTALLSRTTKPATQIGGQRMVRDLVLRKALGSGGLVSLADAASAAIIGLHGQRGDEMTNFFAILIAFTGAHLLAVTVATSEPPVDRAWAILEQGFTNK